MLTVHVTLPTGSDAGTRGEWVLPLRRRNDAAGERTLELADATFLGFSSTQMSRHTGHGPGEYAAQGGVRCSACRWYEMRLFRVHDDANPRAQHYVMHHLGGSRVPGEVSLCRYEDAWSGHEVVELVTVRPSPDETDAHGRARAPFLTRPGARLLAQAASHDDAIDDAYVNRNVQ